MKAAIRILRQCFFQPDDSLGEIFARRDIGFESCRAVWFGSRLARERGKVRVISASSSVALKPLTFILSP